MLMVDPVERRSHLMIEDLKQFYTSMLALRTIHSFAIAPSNYHVSLLPKIDVGHNYYRRR